MKKILIAINSRDMDEQAVNFACYLSRLTQSGLTGIFLDNLMLEEEVIVSQAEEGVVIESFTIREMPDTDEMIQLKTLNIDRFRDICWEKEVQPYVLVDNGRPVLDILAKSHFADMLVVDAATSFSYVQEGPPTRFVKDILQEAGCPVIIAPSKFHGINNIVFCYNGSKSSIFAIKQFSYLFPQLHDRKAKVIYLNGHQDFPEEEVAMLTDWLQYHYSDVEFMAVGEDSTRAFFDYLIEKQNDMVVMGAYGRGLLDSFFRKEGHGESIRPTALPIFVAHL